MPSGAVALNVPLPPRGVLRFALIGLLAALAWQLGHRSGLRDGVRDGLRAAETRTVARDDASRSAAAGRLAEWATERDALTRERDVARATIVALRVELERQGRLSADERAELELYRRIGGDELPTGLTIDGIERRRGPPAVLAITLVQARGRGRVRGRVEVHVEPAAAGSGAATPVANGDDGAAARGAGRRSGLDEPVWSTMFDLRFFETLELPLDAVGEPFPDALVVEVIPEGSRHDAFRRRVERGAIRIVD